MDDPHPVDVACDSLKQLQAKVDWAHDMVQKVTTVMQAEQERSSAIEAAAAADRVRLEKAESGLRSLKLSIDSNAIAIHHLRKDLSTIGKHLDETADRVTAHDANIDSLGDRVGALEEKVDGVGHQVDQVGQAAQDLRSALAATDATASSQATELCSCQKTMANLQDRLHQACNRLLAVEAAQEATADTLHRTLEETLMPAVAMAESERLRLDQVGAQVAALEAQGEKLDEHVTHLQAASETAMRKLEDHQQHLGAVQAAWETLGSDVAHDRAKAKEDRILIDDSSRHITVLEQDLLDIRAVCRSVRGEVADLTADSQQREAQVGRVVNSLTCLREDWERTDIKTSGLEAFVEKVPRAIAP